MASVAFAIRNRALVAAAVALAALADDGGGSGALRGTSPLESPGDDDGSDILRTSPGVGGDGSGVSSPGVAGTTCAGEWAPCLESRCCASAGFQCFAKNPHFAQCRSSCAPGVHEDDPPEYRDPWSCEPVSEGGCAGDWRPCLQTRCCSSPGFQCFAKNDNFAQCRSSCAPGVHEDDLPEHRDPWSCKLLGGGPVTTPAPTPAPMPPADGIYTLDYEAKKETFFDGWEFSTHQANHGAAVFLGSFDEAKAAGVVYTRRRKAIIRAGGRSAHKYKRDSAKIYTKKAWTYFLVAMRYKHLPYGCGVWPAFFTLGLGQWPDAGEMDIMEYVNDHGHVASFHTSQDCRLDSDEVNRYRSMPDANAGYNGKDYQCFTRFCATCKSLGCAPNKLPKHNGHWWASRPGVLAMERTADHIKIFYIPERNIPEDLDADRPNPKEWDRWLISYYPFSKSPGCPEYKTIMTAQRFFLTINFCGDWAGKVWGKSHTCTGVGPTYNDTATENRAAPLPGQCRAVNPLAEYAPDQDCCTRYIADEEGEYGADEALKTAYFDIRWFKVYT